MNGHIGITARNAFEAVRMKAGEACRLTHYATGAITEKLICHSYGSP